MIPQEQLEPVGTMGRNSWRKILSAIGDATWLILMIDNIPVPWRAAEWTRELAEQYAGCEAYMLRSEMEADEDDEYMSWDELVGYTVINRGEGTLGVVESIDDRTANVLLFLDSGRIVPAHEDLILSLDTDTRELIMDLPLGL